MEPNHPARVVALEVLHMLDHLLPEPYKFSGLAQATDKHGNHAVLCASE